MSLNENISKEWLILEQCAILLDPENHREPLVELISDKSVNWGELLHQALRHGLLPAMAHIICNNGLIEKVPSEFQDILFSALLINRHALNIGYGEITKIVNAFNDQSIKFAVTKGYTFDSTIYNSLRIRKTNDIDLLLPPTDKTRAFDILKSLGYIPGYFNNISNSIVDMPEETMKIYAMLAEFSHELVIKIPDPIVQSMCVDITCSLTWFNSQYKISMSDALQDRVMLDIPGHEGQKMPCLNPEYQIIYTALHLFKEAWVEIYGIKDGNDVSLMKFVDIYYLLKRNKDSLRNSRLRVIITENDISLPMLWVLKHTDRLFNCNFCEEFGFNEPVSESWLSSWQTKNYKTSYWKGTMRERLQNKNREGLFIR